MSIKKIKHSILFNKGKTKTNYEAVFNFFDETAPNQRDEVAKRISYDQENSYDPYYYSGKKDIATYLVDQGAKFVDPHRKRTYLSNNQIHYWIDFSKRKLEVKVTAVAEKEVPKDKVLNSDELNTFLKTGEYKYKTHWENAGFNKKK